MMGALYEKLNDDFEAHSGELLDYEYARVLYLWEVLYDCPVAFWRLSETTGTTAYDVTSNSLDGTYQGAYTLGADGAVPENGGVGFDGSSGAVMVAHDPILRLDAAWSIEFWMRTTGTIANTPGVIWRGDPTTSDGYAIYFANTNVVTLFRNNIAYNTSAILDSEWRHFVVTYDLSNVIWYVDGEEDASWTGVSFPASATSDVVYFGRYFTDYADIELDEVAFYATALSAERIKIHYQAAKQEILAKPIFNTVDSGKHYDLRAYHNMDLTVPITMNDLRLQHASYWTGRTMLELSNQRVVEGRRFRPAAMTDVEGIAGATLENMPMLDVERYTLSLGNEEWPIDPDVTVGKVSNWQYANALQIQTKTGRSKEVASYFLDDIETDFNGGTCWIELVLRDFPAQAEYAHLDLDNSFVDFSSHDQFEEEQTDSVAFSESVTDLTAGGDLYWKIPKSRLTKVSYRDLRRIKFRLQAEAVTPPGAPSASVNGAGSLNDPQQYQVTWVTAYGESIPSNFSSPVTPSSQSIDVTIPLGPEGVIGRKLYRRGGTNQPGTMTYLGTLIQSTLNARTMDQIENYYANGVGLVATINDNTTTLVNDDETVLGAEPPDEDTSANFTAKFQTMRLYEDGHDWNSQVYVDTKRFQLARQIPKGGAPEWISDFPPIILLTTRPQNISQYVKFNSGHHAPGGKENAFAFLMRFDPDTGKCLSARVEVSPGATKITLHQNGEPIATATGSALTEETDYYLRVDLYNTSFQARLYEASGVYLGTLIADTSATVSYVKRGYTGFWFQPYTYDFVIDYSRCKRAEFAHYESSEFPSIRPVLGASLYPHTSEAINLMEDATWISSGEDVTVEISETLGQPPPAYTLTRLGTSWYGGQESDERVILGDPEEVLITGYIYPKTRLQGAFRVALIDKNESVGYIASIPGLVANKWNYFELPIEADIIPAGYRFLIHQAGFYSDEFWLDEIALKHQAIVWEGAATPAGTWERFAHAIGRRYSAIHFAERGMQLRVRATALSDSCRMQGYELIPIYAYPGQRESVK